MPPHPPPHTHHKHHKKDKKEKKDKRRDEVSNDFIDKRALEDALAPFVPAHADRSFLVRCLVEEGPAHHRGANDVLLRLLARVPVRRAPDLTDREPVPMRLPPHLQDDRDDDDDATYPIGLPKRLLTLLSDDVDEQRAMSACLTQGPPQHVLANVVMMCMIDRLLEDGPQQQP